MWRNRAQLLGWRLENGHRIEARVLVSFYEPRGELQVVSISTQDIDLGYVSPPGVRNAPTSITPGKSSACISVATSKDTITSVTSASSRVKPRIRVRLVMAPPEVLDYVAAHEVAHLRHMDHSADFHALVDELHDGDVSAARAWLRREGRGLHRYR